MLDPEENAGSAGESATESATDASAEATPAAAPRVAKKTVRRRAAGRPAGPPAAAIDPFATPQAATSDASAEAPVEEQPAAEPAKKPAKKATRKPAKKAAVKKSTAAEESAGENPVGENPAVESPVGESSAPEAPAAVAAGLLFQAPPETLAPARPAAKAANQPSDEPSGGQAHDDSDDSGDDSDEPKRRRRSRGGRRRRKSDDSDSTDGNDNDSNNDSGSADESGNDADSNGEQNEGGTTTRRRRKRARAGESAEVDPDDPENTVVKVREGRTAADEITGVTGSTRLEAKKQRRREGREAGRRRAPIVTEAEFLARRESVNRQMLVRQADDYTQIAVLEDGVLVEHYVARESQVSIIGNVYLGKVQNVLPSMEAAFIDIGEGRNAVLYAGEVDWSNYENGKQRKIEEALKPGQSVLVQVSKDPIGQKGARLTSQISLPGRFLVYVPGGGASGISRKLPDSERARLKGLLKEVVPDDGNVIVRTAAEGATEEQLTRDVTALTARWTDIESKIESGKAPELLYAEPDLMIKVIRDLFNEDFAQLIVEGPDAWDMVSGYISHVAPDLDERVSQWKAEEHDGTDLFGEHRLDEQIHKALDRKVNLPSGGSLVIDRTEAMTVVDVNTGRFTGSGGNLEETVTKNNLEAAEEIVRQLRLRDIGGIIVIDFIDMVLESNRDLVLRRLVECLGRDRTRHQVAEVTSLGLVQMTRKRIGTGLLESFSHDCEHCKGRGVVVSATPVEPKKDEPPRRSRGRGRSRGGNSGGNNSGGSNQGNQNQGNSNQNKSGESKSSDTKPAEDKPAEDKPAEDKPAENKSSESPSGDKKPAEPARIIGSKGPEAPVLTDTGSDT